MLFNLRTCVWTDSHAIIWILLLMCWYDVNDVTIFVDCSAIHHTDLSHEPFYNNHRTCLRLIHECCMCYLTLYDVTVASKWTAPPEDVHVLLCCVFLSKLELIPFNLELTFTSFPLLSVRNSHTPSLTHCISHTLTTDRDILLASVWHRSQEITLQPTAGTPTPKGLRYNWNFLPEISP